jgi:ABC-2 type transport system permease protein
MNSVSLFFRVMLARAYPRVIGLRRTPGWVILETLMPMLSVSAMVLVYRAMQAPEEYVGFVILGGAMTAFWLNVLWAMGAQLYWDREAGNLELYIASPAPMMAILAGMALGGMALTLVRACTIMAMGVFLFDVALAPSSWLTLTGVFVLTMLALYGLGMLFASVFLLWGREALHVVSLLQEPVYLLSGLNFPVRILGNSVASVAAILPLTAGVDAMRQVLFPETGHIGLLPVWVEVTMLGVMAVVFIALARSLLRYIERKAREEGKLTVRWL